MFQGSNFIIAITITVITSMLEAELEFIWEYHFIESHLEYMTKKPQFIMTEMCLEKDQKNHTHESLNEGLKRRPIPSVSDSRNQEVICTQILMKIESYSLCFPLELQNSYWSEFVEYISMFPQRGTFKEKNLTVFHVGVFSYIYK